MSLFESVILGAVQGLSEFIPVSSSGHLILARELLGMSVGASDLAFDAVLQLATSLAVLFYFRYEIIRLVTTFFHYVSGKPTEVADKNLMFAVLVGTIPAVIFGLLLESYMETTFRSSALVAWTLIAGAVLMFVADRVKRTETTPNTRTGLFVGLFQTLALIPGISRSGATISGGLFAGFSRENAARFSFILALPILFGSGLKKLLDLGTAGTLGDIGLSLIVGSVVAFVSGFLAISFLLKFLKTNNLNIFVVYRVILALVILVLL